MTVSNRPTNCSPMSISSSLSAQSGVDVNGVVRRGSCDHVMFCLSTLTTTKIHRTTKKGGEFAVPEANIDVLDLWV